MYERYYGLRERPFSLLPNPDFLYFSRQHYIAYGLLEYGLTQQAGFVVITGEIGTGKTTLLRRLMGHLTPDVDVGFIVNTHPEFGGLLQWVADAFGIEGVGNTPVEQYRAFVRFLQSNAKRGRRALLIVDEGQNLNAKGLEELRTLSNINGAQQLLQIMLIGQPELRHTLRRPELEQFAQRVTVDYHLQPLTREETRAYIKHRLSVAGAGERQIFPDATLDFVHAYSRGVPRLINMICDAALVYGYASQQPAIDPKLIEEVVRDRLKGGILPVSTDERATAP
jgi:type II secretory pathway predicted ATPase ExeA